MVCLPSSASSCLARRLRLSGQKRVPRPPARITGWKRGLVIELSNAISDLRFEIADWRIYTFNLKSEITNLQLSLHSCCWLGQRFTRHVCLQELDRPLRADAKFIRTGWDDNRIPLRQSNRRHARGFNDCATLHRDQNLHRSLAGLSSCSETVRSFEFEHVDDEIR